MNQSTKKVKAAAVEHKNVRAIKKAKIDGCKRHPGAYLVTDDHTGDLLCSKCGYVIDERMICDDAEWRNFEADSNAVKNLKSRVGGNENPFLGDDGNLGTIVQITGNDERQSAYSESIKNAYKKRDVDRALSVAFSRISEMCDRMQLPEIVAQSAKKLYADSYRSFKLKGTIQTADAKVAAAVYIACRKEQCSRSSREITAFSECQRREIVSAATRMLKVLPIQVDKENAIHLIGRIRGHLNLPREIERAAIEIIESVMALVTERKFYAETVAGSSIYLAQKRWLEVTDATLLRIFRNQIGQVVGLSEQTIQRVGNLIERS